MPLSVKSALDNLLLCERCSHGAPFHEPSGCNVARCQCRLSRGAIVEDALRLAAEDIRQTWRMPEAEAS